MTGGFKNMNADQIIKCILGTMLKLEKTVDSNLNNKLDRGGYQGNAQDLSDSIESIYQPDTVIRYTAPTRVGNTFTFPNGGYDVLLSKQFHTNTSELETTIAAATDGFKRIDLIYYKADDTIAKIQGTESATVAVRPEVPAGGIELCLINVFGATIEVPEVNGAYVQKSERANVVLTGSGVINQLDLVDEKATIVFKGSITQLNTISYASVPYNGKRITLFNAQATPVTIGHSVSGYGVDFVFSDGQDYILLPNQTIEFSFDITYAPYAHHMLIGSKGIATWSELQGKPSTFPPSAHTHTISEITDFPTFKTIEGQSVIGAGNIDLDKNSVGLGNVDNTSDLNKIISTATQTALNAKANISGQVFTGAVSATNLSGTNTGDNAPNSLYSGLVTNATHTGEVTGSTALTITNKAVTNAKLANVATSTLKGRVSATTGVVEDLTASQVRTLLNVADGANNYVHPANHLASIITQDASNRFVTDTEKSAWNAKEPAIASGTISQYWRGDKTWQEFPTIQTIDNIPTDGSNNAVSSNGVFDALSTKAPISSVHNPVTLGTANGLSLSTQQLSLGLASSGVTGALSGTDWNTFNGKFNTPTGLTTNYLPKWNGSGFGNSQIFDNGGTDISIINGLYSEFSIKGNQSLENGGGQINFSNQTKRFATISGETESPNSGMFIVRTLRAGELIESLRIVGNGNIGIGTAYPTFSKLSIKGNDGNFIGYFYNNSGTAGQVKGVVIEAGTNTSDFALLVNSSQGSPYFKVNGNGNSLFGTTSDNLVDRVQVAGTISASPATTANQVPTWGQVQAAALPYKLYTFYVNQSGANIPTSVALNNNITLPSTLTWERTGVGDYRFFIGTVNPTKVFPYAVQSSWTFGNDIYAASVQGQYIQITRRTNGVLTDGLINILFEIRQYP